MPTIVLNQWEITADYLEDDLLDGVMPVLFAVKVKERKHKMTSPEYIRAMKAVDYLRNGAPSHQMSSLPGCFVKNASSTLKYGRQISDNIATWISEGFAPDLSKSPLAKIFA